MAEYRNKTTGEVKTKREWMSENPGTSFPRVWSKDTLNFLNLDPVLESPKPDVSQYQNVIRDGVIQDAKGNWVQAWRIVDKTEEEIYASLPFKTPEDVRKEMVRWINSISSQILDLYPLAVQARWNIEEAAARAVLSNTAAEDQLVLITREGAAKGRTPEEHAQAIINKANKFRAITDQINTLFLATDAKIQQTDDPTQFVEILAQAKEKAKPLAVAYGFKL